MTQWMIVMDCGDELPRIGDLITLASRLWPSSCPLFDARLGCELGSVRHTPAFNPSSEASMESMECSADSEVLHHMVCGRLRAVATSVPRE